MTSPTLLQLDTRDDRREIWHLLHRLSPKRRAAYLAWCCSRVAGPGQTRPTVSHRMTETVVMSYRSGEHDLRLTNEVYTDVLALAAQWGLDLAAAAVELERRVKSQDAPRRN